MVVNSGSKCNLLLGIYHPFHLGFYVIVLHMSVSIQGDANVRVSHQILQSFGIHTAFGHVGTKRMSANMRRDVGQLFPIELVVARTDVVEVVFPVHCNGWVSVLVKKEKTAFTVNHRLVLGTRPIFNNAPEAHIHIIRHRNHPLTTAGLGFLYHIPHIHCPLQLMVHIDFPMFQINIGQRQPYEL